MLRKIFVPLLITAFLLAACGQNVTPATVLLMQTNDAARKTQAWSDESLNATVQVRVVNTVSAIMTKTAHPTTKTATRTPAPSATATKTVTPTTVGSPTATQLGDQCPRVDPSEYSVKFVYNQETGVLEVYATLCHFVIDGKKVWGIYNGLDSKNANRLTWKYILVVDKDGVTRGTNIFPGYISNFGGCWKMSNTTIYEMWYYMCTAPAWAATPTTTAMPR